MNHDHNTMKKAIFILTIGLAIINLKVRGQGSWNYTIWFNLYDKTGENIGPEDYKKKNIKLYNASYGHTRGKLSYDPLANAFKLSQQTTAASHPILLVNDQDSIVLQTSPAMIYVKDISLIKGSYNITRSNNSEKYDNGKPLQGYKDIIVYRNIVNFEAFKTNKKIWINPKSTTEVKLE